MQLAGLLKISKKAACMFERLEHRIYIETNTYLGVGERMDKDLNQKPHTGDEEKRPDGSQEASNQEETINQHASTYQPEINHPHQEPVQQTEGNSSQNNQSAGSKEKKVNFDFEKSLQETKGIVKDAILRPHSLISSNRSISVETSAIILVLLSLIVGVFGYFALRNIMDNMFGGFGSLFGESIGVDFLFKTMLAWILTFAVGYFSLYFMLSYLGNHKMEHKLLLTKYVIVNIPFVLVFCLVLVFFGLLMIDYFMVMYIFSLMLFGMIHIYLFIVNVKKPKFDLFWLSSGYLFVLILVTYYLAGVELPGF